MMISIEYCLLCILGGIGSEGIYLVSWIFQWFKWRNRHRQSAYFSLSHIFPCLFIPEPPWFLPFLVFNSSPKHSTISFAQPQNLFKAFLNKFCTVSLTSYSMINLLFFPHFEMHDNCLPFLSITNFWFNPFKVTLEWFLQWLYHSVTVEFWSPVIC